MRQRVQLQSKVTSADGGGSQVIAWSTFATVYASIEPQSGQERLFRDQLQEQLTHTNTVHSRTDPTIKHRLVSSSNNKRVSDTRALKTRTSIHPDTS